MPIQAELEAELEQELAGYGADPASGRMTDRQYEVRPMAYDSYACLLCTLAGREDPSRWLAHVVGSCGV